MLILYITVSCNVLTYINYFLLCNVLLFDVDKICKVSRIFQCGNVPSLSWVDFVSSHLTRVQEVLRVTENWDTNTQACGICNHLQYRHYNSLLLLDAPLYKLVKTALILLFVQLHISIRNEPVVVIFYCTMEFLDRL